MTFFSHILNPSELKYAAVEKEAHAIIEAIRKWHHLLYNRQFKLITDQRSVAVMFACQKLSKIKNEKIQR